MSDVIKIYGSKNSSAARCLWLLEELNVPYEQITLDISKGENKTPQYLKLNPNGKIPTLVDGDVVVWESLAINYYLMEKFQAVHLVGTTAAEHAQVNQWSLWSLIHLYPAFYPLVMKKWRNGPDTEATKHALEVDLPRFLPVLDGHLADKEYMALGRFTLADISAMSAANAANFIGYDLTAYKNITRWMKMLSERPAFKKLFA